MANEKLISFDLKADFAFFKKPDYNDGLLLSYNMLHKPALLGVLGALTGMQGHQRKGELPEYYVKLRSLMVAIEPIGHEKGNFKKTSVKYTNTVGYANLDGNLLIEETMLIRPSYRCYLLLNLDNADDKKIHEYLLSGFADYIPYLGKNEYQAWIEDNVKEYQFSSYAPKGEFKIASIFIKEDTLRKQKIIQRFSFTTNSMVEEDAYCYFETLPTGFDQDLMQYEMSHFVYTNWVLKHDTTIKDLYEITDNKGTTQIIQLF